MRIVRLLVIILFALASVFFGCQQGTPKYTTVKKTVYSLPDTLSGIYIKRQAGHGWNDTLNHVFYETDSIYYEESNPFILGLGSIDFGAADTIHPSHLEKLVEETLKNSYPDSIYLNPNHR